MFFSQVCRRHVAGGDAVSRGDPWTGTRLRAVLGWGFDVSVAGPMHFLTMGWGTRSFLLKAWPRSTPFFVRHYAAVSRG